MKIRKGEFAVRYTSERDHKQHGWIFKNVHSLSAAIDAADMYLAENGLDCVMLDIVDYTGSVVENVSRES